MTSAPAIYLLNLHDTRATVILVDLTFDTVFELC